MRPSTGPDRIAETSPRRTNLATLNALAVDALRQENAEENYASATAEKNSEGRSRARRPSVPPSARALGFKETLICAAPPLAVCRETMEGPPEKCFMATLKRALAAGRRQDLAAGRV